MATIDRKNRQYSDISLLFNINDYTKDIYKKNDEEAVKASLRNLISTRNYERPFHPEIGCQLFGLLFENYTPTVKTILKQTIYDVVEKFEPRATLLNVRINDGADNNEVIVDITFKLINSEKPVRFQTAITRVR